MNIKGSSREGEYPGGFLASPDALEVMLVTYSVTESALALTWLMWPMIPIEDLTDVTLAIGDTDEDEEDDEK